MNYYLITLQEDQHYCYNEKPSLSQQIFNLTNGVYCKVFPDTFIIRSDKDLKYWTAKIRELGGEYIKPFIIVKLSSSYFDMLDGYIPTSKWNWLTEEAKVNFDATNHLKEVSIK